MSAWDSKSADFLSDAKNARPHYMSVRAGATKMLLLRVMKSVDDARLSGSGVRPGSKVYATKGPGYVEFIRDERDDRQVRKTFWALRRHAFIAVRAHGDRFLVALTDKGRCAALKASIIAAPKTSTGRCCLVSFDIPESRRSARNAARKLLRNLGFRQEHQSLWSSRGDVADPMSRLLAMTEFGGWVKVFDAQRRRTKNS